MKKPEPKKMTLGEFAKFYEITLAKDARPESEGRRIPTGEISLPPYYWVHENTYQKMK